MAQHRSYDPEQVFQEKYRQFMDLEVPPCTQCGSTSTASVQVGVIGVTIRLAATCPKFKLIPNGPKPGEWFCRSCQEYFDAPHEGDEGDSRFGSSGCLSCPP